MNVKNYDQVVTALAQILLAANSEGKKDSYGYAPWAKFGDGNQYSFKNYGDSAKSFDSDDFCGRCGDAPRLYGEIHDALVTLAGEEFTTNLCETLEIDLTLANRRTK